MTPPPKVWDDILGHLRGELPPQTVGAWLDGIRIEVADQVLRLHCPSVFHRERVRKRCLPAIRKALAESSSSGLGVELVLSPGDAASFQRALQPVSPAGPTPPPVRAVPEQPRVRPGSPRAAAPSEAAAAQADPEKPDALTFDNFVVGPCNNLAREASMALCNGESRALRQLYLSAASGLGKTHLCRALASEVEREGGGRVLYSSAENFTSEFMASLARKQTARFKRRYRQECEVLILEDVQFLQGKKATQLELFHTIQHLLDTDRRVVVTGDRLPRDLLGLEEQVRSQLSSGLIAPLEDPSALVRRRILRAKADGGGVHVPPDCLDMLVESVHGSVRDLEGALVQLVTTASLLKRKIDARLTEEALQTKTALPTVPRPRDPGTVIRTVARFFKTTPEVMASRSRRRDVLRPRQLAMYLCHRYTQASMAEIGRALGRDHPAVSNAIKRVEREMLERAPLRYQVEALCERLREESD